MRLIIFLPPFAGGLPLPQVSLPAAHLCRHPVGRLLGGSQFSQFLLLGFHFCCRFVGASGGCFRCRPQQPGLRHGLCQSTGAVVPFFEHRLFLDQLLDFRFTRLQFQPALVGSLLPFRSDGQSRLTLLKALQRRG